MILWTVEQPERIFPRKPEMIAYRNVDGGILEGVDTPDGFRIGRLISTNPALYLRADFAPGTIRK